MPDCQDGGSTTTPGGDRYATNRGRFCPLLAHAGLEILILARDIVEHRRR